MHAMSAMCAVFSLLSHKNNDNDHDNKKEYGEQE